MIVDFYKITDSSNSEFRYTERSKVQIIGDILGSICNGDIRIITDDVKYNDLGLFDMSITINGKELDPNIFLEDLNLVISDKWDKIREFEDNFKSKNSSNAKLEKAIKQLNAIKVQMNNVESILLDISKR